MTQDQTSKPHTGSAALLGALNLILAIMGTLALFQIWGSVEPLAAAEGVGQVAVKVWPIPRFTF